MEEKKFDLNSLIGFVLLGAIMLWWVYSNQPSAEELAKQKIEQIQDSIQKAEQLITPEKVVEDTTSTTINPTDSLALVNAQNALGAFSYSL